MEQDQTVGDFARELEASLDAPDAPDVSDSAAWSRRFGGAGLLAPTWAPEHGGLGLDRERAELVEAVLRERGTRRGVNGGLEMLAPVLLEYATPEQLLEFLLPIARAETPLLSSAAKAMASETARHVIEKSLQLHGGLGMTEEQDIGLYIERARGQQRALRRRELPLPAHRAPERVLGGEGQMLVTREDKEGVATLTLNRPEKLNAIDIPLMIELRTHLDTLAGHASVGCVVLTGAGRSFCAGHDLESIASASALPARHFEPETVDALEALPMPTIAKIRGHCFTGGLELALACDLLIAAEGRRARRHPRAVGPGSGVGNVRASAGARRPIARQGADVHEPPHRRGAGGRARSRGPRGPGGRARRRGRRARGGDHRQLLGHEPHRQGAPRLAREPLAKRCAAHRTERALRVPRGPGGAHVGEPEAGQDGPLAGRPIGRGGVGHRRGAYGGGKRCATGCSYSL